MTAPLPGLPLHLFILVSKRLPWSVSSLIVVALKLDPTPQASTKACQALLANEGGLLGGVYLCMFVCRRLL